LVPPNDPQAIAAAAFRLLEEPGLGARLASNGRHECRKYVPSAIANQWIALYSALAANAWTAGESESPRSALT
jgi:glycosyltransferase involved in cell wall biosynthesis